MKIMKLLKLTEFIDKYFHQGELMIYMGSWGGVFGLMIYIIKSIFSFSFIFILYALIIILMFLIMIFFFIMLIKSFFG
jgi:hypothetical protein